MSDKLGENLTRFTEHLPGFHNSYNSNFSKHLLENQHSKETIDFGPETHPSYLHLSSHPAAIREPDGLCGTQRYSREVPTVGIMVPKHVKPNTKHNKVINGIYLDFILQLLK